MIRSGTPCTPTRTEESWRAITDDMNDPNPLTTVPSSTTRTCLWSASTADSVTSSYGLRYRQFTTVTLRPSAASASAAEIDGSTIVPTAKMATSAPRRTTSHVAYGIASIAAMAGGASGAASRG